MPGQLRTRTRYNVNKKVRYSNRNSSQKPQVKKRDLVPKVVQYQWCRAHAPRLNKYYGIATVPMTNNPENVIAPRHVVSIISKQRKILASF